MSDANRAGRKARPLEKLSEFQTLQVLGRHVALSRKSLASYRGLSEVAIYGHLCLLRQRGLVDLARPNGRKERRWYLTEDGRKAVNR